MRKVSAGLAALPLLVLLSGPGEVRAKGKGEFGIRALVSPFEADPLAWELDRVARKIIADPSSTFLDPEVSQPDAGRIAGGVDFHFDMVWKKPGAWKSALRSGLEIRALNPRDISTSIRDNFYGYSYSDNVLRLKMTLTEYIATIGIVTRFGDDQLTIYGGGGLTSLHTLYHNGNTFFWYWDAGENSENLSSGTVFLGGAELNHRLGGPVLLSLALEIQSLEFMDLRYSDFELPLHWNDLGAGGRLGLTFAPGWTGTRPRLRKPEPEPEPEPQEDEE